MTEYTVAALPTVYRGRQYRSRLEARWAAFFDRLGWTHEYEPFDLGKWTPDFIITEPLKALVEVKPLTEFDVDIAEKMNGTQKGFLILTRAAPVIVDTFVHIGWLTISHCPALILWRRLKSKPALYADTLTFLYDGAERKTSDWVMASTGEVGRIDTATNGFRYADYTMELWADACNAVQWEPKP